VLFLGLNMQDLTGDARAFIRDFDNTYLNVRDRSNGVARDWGVTGIPESFFITAEGRVVGHVIDVSPPSGCARAWLPAARAGRWVRWRAAIAARRGSHPPRSATGGGTRAECRPSRGRPYAAPGVAPDRGSPPGKGSGASCSGSSSASRVASERS
jgi:hypothetical protein